MKLLKNMRSFLLEETFKINYINNKIDIVNYTSIEHFDSNKIIVNYNKGSVSVNGKNLVVSRLLSDELLIEGDIEKVEFR